MAKTNKEPAVEQEEMVTVRGLRNEDVAVIVNGEVRVIPQGGEITVEKRFADEFYRSERAKDAFVLNQKELESKDI